MNIIQRHQIQRLLAPIAHITFSRNRHNRRWCTFFSSWCAFLHRHHKSLANLGQFWWIYALFGELLSGLNSVVVYQNWQISGMISAPSGICAHYQKLCIEIARTEKSSRKDLRFNVSTVSTGLSQIEYQWGQVRWRTLVIWWSRLQMWPGNLTGLI